MKTARIASFLLVASGVMAVGLPDRADAPASQVAQYNADVPKTILELQQFRQTSSVHIRSGSGKDGTATLVNLNPDINSWYLLTVAWKDPAAGTSAETAWHLENARPHDARISVDEKFPSGLVITEGRNRYPCDLFGAKSSTGGLEQGRSSTQIYYPLCEGRVYLRNPAKGARTALESTAEFLRTQVWGGEQVVDMFHHILGDRYRQTAELQNGNSGTDANPPGSPVPAQVDPDLAHRLVTPSGLGITLESQNAMKHGMSAGAWYQAAGNPGVYVSVLQPNLIAPDILWLGLALFYPQQFPDLPNSCTMLPSANAPGNDPPTLPPVLANGLQVFPGGFPIYRGTTLVGGIGVSGDGVDQDDFISFLGLYNAGQVLHSGIGHAPAAMRASTLTANGIAPRYVNCPYAPFLNGGGSNICNGK